MNRVGFGFDSHRFEAGRPLILGGVTIEHDRGLAGHSDADVVLHAIMDAMFGAAAAGDIGEHFPDTDPTWAGANSGDMATETQMLLAEMGWLVANVDLTIICQSPKLGEQKSMIRQQISDLLGMDSSFVSVKAKTAEGMGFIGNGEGIAVFAVVMLEEMSG